MHPHQSRLALAASLLFLTVALPSDAAMQHRMSAETLAPLAAPLKIGARLQIARVPLIDGEEATLELERFQLWADNVEIEVFGEGQQVVESLAPPAAQYFRGQVAGHPGSLVFLSTAGRRVEGLIYLADRKFAVGSDRGAVVIEESTFIDDLPMESETFVCDIEGAEVQQPPRPHAITDASGVPVVHAAPAGTQRSVINLAVETDSELYAKVGNSAANMTTYIGNLIAAVSTIYERDLETEIRIVYLGMQSSAASDVFNITPGQTGLWNGSSVTYTALHGMLQLGDRWALNPPTANRYSAATLISGTSAGSGIAWLGTLCTGPFLCGSGNCGSAAAAGHYAGPYSFNGGITPPGNLSAPNPDANPNYVAGSGYWPLLQVSHELGHNVGSRHTHCITLTAAQKTEYGVTRNYVDTCFNGEGGCYGGGTSVPAEKGSVMSYCHLSGGSNTRYTFGQDGETSEVVVNNMLGNMAGKTPAMSAITAPASLDPNVSGNASVTNAGLTYTWSIANGTFAGGGTTASGASVSFSGTVNPVLLTVTATNNSGCSVTDTKSVTINTAVLIAPQGLTATPAGATSVTLAWSAVDDATGYEIFRSPLGANFVSIGTSPGPSYNDATAAAGTAYLYRVRATAGGSNGPFSASDLATTTVFTDPALTGATPIKLAHFTELLSAVNAVRSLAGLGAASFTAPAPAGSVTVRRTHLLELRTALDAARATLGLPALGYTDPAITVGATRIKAAHLTELRNGVR